MPEYCYPDDDIPVGGNIEWSGGDLGFFYGENINYQKNSQISERLEKYKRKSFELISLFEVEEVAEWKERTILFLSGI